MLARRLTTEGIERFEDFLERLKQNPQSRIPAYALSDEGLSEAVEARIPVEPIIAATRMDVAKRVFQLLQRDTETLRIDKGFWCWLSLFWFNDLCPVVDGKRVPGDRYRWIAELDNTRRACRHLLAGPYQIYRAHRDNPSRANAFLCGGVHQQGELLAQIASRPSLVTCKAVAGVATKLYYDEEHQRIRRGCSGRGPGSARRFADVLSQLDLTWDLHSLNVQELLALLPDEFDAFLDSQPRQRQLLLIE
ncbi:MAG: hypothetical protein R3C59_01265 [Planctomycetaceae bacterium]